MSRLTILGLSVISLVLVGCASIIKEESTTTTLAGVFKDEKCDDKKSCPQNQIYRFIENSRNIKDGVTVFDDLKRLGFDPKAENVLIYPGAQGRKYYLGTENVQIVLSHPKQTLEYIEEDSKFLTIVYPLIHTIDLTDRIYFSNKESRTRGSTLQFVIILYNNVVKKHYYVGTENLDKKKVESAFGKGAFEIIKGLSGAASIISPVKELIP